MHQVSTSIQHQLCLASVGPATDVSNPRTLISGATLGQHCLLVVRNVAVVRHAVTRNKKITNCNKFESTVLYYIN